MPLVYSRELIYRFVRLLNRQLMYRSVSPFVSVNPKSSSKGGVSIIWSVFGLDFEVEKKSHQIDPKLARCIILDMSFKKFYILENVQVSLLPQESLKHEQFLEFHEKLHVFQHCDKYKK